MVNHTYLKNLADDELSNCVRYLSKEPLSNWYEHLQLANRKLVFDKDGPFARIVGHFITRLAVNQAATAEGFVEIHPGDAFGVRILQDWGSSITEAEINLRHISVSGILQTCCPSIRRLTLNLDFRLVLNPSPTRLACLQLSHGALEFIKETLPSFSNLKLLQVNGPALQHMSSAIQSNCETLESVTLNSRRDTNWKTIFADLYACVNLRDVELKGYVPSDEHTALLESLGPKLERAVMDEMDEHLCERVVTSCPNMICDLVVHASNLRKLMILGKHIRQVTLRYTADTEGIGSMEAATIQCPNISALCCNAEGGSGGPVIRMFTCMKRRLDYIELQGLTFSAELIRSIRSYTENLRTFIIVADLIHDFSGLIRLLEVNQQLEKVEIMEGSDNVESVGLAKVSKILRATKVHRQLRKLQIVFLMKVSKSSDLAITTECVPFRHRRVKVEVNNKVYCV